MCVYAWGKLVLLELYVTEGLPLLHLLNPLADMAALTRTSEVSWSLLGKMHIFGLSQGKTADLDNGNFNHNMAAYFKHVSRSVVTDTSLKGRKNP